MGDQALQLFDSMLNQGVMADETAFKAALIACEKGKYFKQAVDVFDSMLMSGMVPDIGTLNDLICACERGNEPDVAVDLYNSWKNPWARHTYALVGSFNEWTDSGDELIRQGEYSNVYIGEVTVSPGE